MKRLSITLAILLSVATMLVCASLKGQNVVPSPKSIECTLELIEEAQVPAEEPGTIFLLPVREGMMVKAGDLLAQIDDSQPQVQKLAASAAFEGAKEKANDQIEVTYAIAAAKFASKTCERDREANMKAVNAVSQTDVERNLLDYNRAMLGIEKARHDLKLASYDAATKSAEVKAADLAIRRRKIVAPFDGQVVELNVHRGEWVKPGDSVLRMVRLDRLKAEARLNVLEYNPNKMLDTPVSIEVPLANNQKTQVQGRITYCSQLVEGDTCRVFAEFDNQPQPNGRWLLQPGMRAKMQLGTGR